MSPRKLSNILTALTVAAFALTAVVSTTLGVPRNTPDPISAPGTVVGTLGVPTNGSDPISAPAKSALDTAASTLEGDISGGDPISGAPARATSTTVAGTLGVPVEGADPVSAPAIFEDPFGF
jgi:hypothetical protein